VKALASHSCRRDLIGVLLLTLGLFQGSLLLLPLSLLFLPLLTLRLMSEPFFFMFAVHLFSLKEEGLLLASFSVSKNITEWDLILFFDIFCESNAAS
jgi:hypothetical protein